MPCPIAVRRKEACKAYTESGLVLDQFYDERIPDFCVDAVPSFVTVQKNFCRIAREMRQVGDAVEVPKPLSATAAKIARREVSDTLPVVSIPAEVMQFALPEDDDACRGNESVASRCLLRIGIRLQFEFDSADPEALVRSLVNQVGFRA